MQSYSFVNQLPKEVQKLCTPAFIYLVLSVISTLIYLIAMFSAGSNPTLNGTDVNIHKYTFGGLLMKVIWHLLFICFLNYLCKKKHTTIAWVVLFLPFILMGLIAMLLMFLFSLVVGTTGNLDEERTQVVEEKQESYQDDGRPSISQTNQHLTDVVGFNL